MCIYIYIYIYIIIDSTCYAVFIGMSIYPIHLSIHLAGWLRSKPKAGLRSRPPSQAVDLYPQPHPQPQTINP